jgi:hypothetical protein
MPPRRTETTRKSLIINPIVIALLLAAAGWSGLAYLIFEVHPTPQTKAAFLGLWACALMGTAWPVLLAIHRRFRGEPPVGTVWRQSAWVAILGAACAWLQINRWLNAALVAILFGVFVVIELLLSLRARQEDKRDDD